MAHHSIHQMWENFKKINPMHQNVMQRGHLVIRKK